jgi:hypothetical protein
MRSRPAWTPPRPGTPQEVRRLLERARHDDLPLPQTPEQADRLRRMLTSVPEEEDDPAAWHAPCQGQGRPRTVAQATRRVRRTPQRSRISGGYGSYPPGDGQGEAPGEEWEPGGFAGPAAAGYLVARRRLLGSGFDPTGRETTAPDGDVDDTDTT